MSFVTLSKIVLCRTSIGSFLGSVPFVERAYRYFMLKNSNTAALFVGIHASHKEALSFIPVQYQSGWDTGKSSKIWVKHPDYIQPTAYTSFFSLSKIVHAGSVVADYGGSIGLTYYGYTSRNDFPATAKWIVVEVPSLVISGQEVALSRNAANLEFISNLESLPDCDILHSAGALQFIEDGVPGFLEKLQTLPQHILLNKVPLTDAESFWTVHNFGASISPYRIYNKSEFLDYFHKFGYEIKDRWEVPDFSCDIPFHPEKSVLRCQGFHLCLKK